MRNYLYIFLFLVYGCSSNDEPTEIKVNLLGTWTYSKTIQGIGCDDFIAIGVYTFSSLNGDLEIIGDTNWQGEIFALDNSGNCVFAIIDSEIPNFHGKPSSQTSNLFLTTISFDGINANEAYRIDSFTNDKIVYITEDINGEIETLTLTR